MAAEAATTVVAAKAVPMEAMAAMVVMAVMVMAMVAMAAAVAATWTTRSACDVRSPIVTNADACRVSMRDFKVCDRCCRITKARN